MKGIDLSKNYYLTYGKPMLEKDFAEYLDRITVGLVGDGSECFGFDDDLSLDHDFEPSFCIWIDSELESKIGFKLERAYAKLPNEFLGYKRKILSPTGGNRRGVLVTEDFYSAHGCYNPDLIDLVRLPSHYLATATNGEIFKTADTEFMQIRNSLINGYPEDVRLKKIAANLVLMGQEGQYNYSRCVLRGELGASQLAIFKFVSHAIHTIYLLNNEYCPFYKWAYKGMRKLAVLGELEPSLVFLTETANDKEMFECKQGMIEDIASTIIKELKAQQITTATCNNLETHAYSVTDKIKNSNIRNLHIMDGEN